MASRIFVRVASDGYADPRELLAALRPFAGKWVQVEAKALNCAPEQLDEEKARTIAQNNYYWGVVVPGVSQYTGYTPDETHAALKERYLTVRSKIRWDKRKTLRFTKSTTSLITKEFAKFVLEIRRDFGPQIDGQRYSTIPAPNQAPSMTKDGVELYLIDPQELARL